ncbi:AMP-binding protein [Burkholderia oklahomensis]|uniref:AMP-binding enzyme family protein n=1 Tax=Burkholderia oklahomensis TaxID=342113 RepID=A0AAI8BCH9_9BURK|nr:AMP-binding protein [Burkholderia oklahomensis]AIO69737.1 AMP-binding enzyme family protein [Burkholderia oklahomensis]AOI39795.1 AMP-dependent synthetase [Burkholderia oklahomensis EO147]KUY67659.1 AMP-dependent synthetase [Burkholderia oklahomensis EO147]QPS39846.1 AMP-binding protein [Burkholderia oklahomensis]
MTAQAFLDARDFLLRHRTDYDTAYRDFKWPALDEFNWALDYFDAIARGNDKPALWIVDAATGDGAQYTFAQMSERSARIANWLRGIGVARGERILLMLPNRVELWDAMLAAMKLGAVVLPATTQLSADDVRDRVRIGGARYAIVDENEAEKFEQPGLDVMKIVAGAPRAGWLALADGYAASAEFTPDGVTHASDPMLLYFTSGTTSKPKLVEHTHRTYPVGSLSTMYWVGLQPGDVHWNISSPGWAKHAWSCFYAPWNAQACVFAFNYARFEPKVVLDALVKYRVTTMCAPPTVWRMLVQQPLATFAVKLREIVGAGEPLNPEIIERVKKAWGVTIRDGYGQTETTCLIGNSPGQRVVPGSMGRPMPGYAIELLDPDGASAGEGEVALPVGPSVERPVGLMKGYANNPEATAHAMRDGHYRTSDIALRRDDGYFVYVGRADDVFKSSDYRLSPFELESVLIEHEAIAEAAVVPSPDPVRLSVPKTFVTLRAGYEPGEALAREIFRFSREKLAPYKRIRRLQFAELPKTISGKIRRVELRRRELERGDDTSGRMPGEYWEEDFAADGK